MKVDGNTKVLGIIGNPIHHTKSPAMHNFISEKLGNNFVYVPFEVTGDVVAAVKGAYELGIVGMNVTVPYKTDVIPTLCEIDGLAEAVGAVNTLVRTPNGYKGYNTDLLGLERAVLSEEISLNGTTAVLLGAGGASRAAAFMCLKQKVSKLYILNRTVSKAEEIANDVLKAAKKEGNDISVVAMPMDDYTKIIEDDLVVFQCTKIGLLETDGCVISDEAFYKKVSYGIDLIYRDTDFCKLVKDFGGKSFNGTKMLLYQGIIAYELWLNQDIPDDIVKGVEKVLNNGQ